MQTELDRRSANRWHERLANTEHHRWYLNLLDFHAITQAWIQELDAERPTHWLQRGMSMSEDVSQTLWMLEKLASASNLQQAGESLEKFFDDSRPEDVLGRLEQTVWAVQGWTLSAILDRGGKSERPAILNQLEQSCWKAGRDCAIRRWPRLPEEARDDARGILAALRDTPLLGTPEQEGLLLIRAVGREASVELLCCPHRLNFGEVPSQGELADELCRLHSHWMRGFGYALNTRVLVDHHLGQGKRRCWQRWYFAS